MITFHKIRTLEASEKQQLIKPVLQVRVNTTEGLFLVNVSDKVSFSTKKNRWLKNINDYHFLSLTKSLCWDVWKINTF